MKPSPRRPLTLVAATLVVIVAMAYVVPVVAQTNNASEVRAAQAQEKKPAEKGKVQEQGKAQQKTAPPTGSILLGVGVGVLLVGVGLLARSRIGPRSSSEDGSFVGAARGVVFQPVGFFRGLPRSGNFANPLLFALICIEVSAVLGWLLVLIGLGKTPSFNPNPQTLGLPSVFTPAFPVVSILLAPIGGAIGILIVALIQQLLVRLIVGSRNSGYEATFRVASYTQVTNLVNWIPIIGPLLALYGIYLAVVGIREMHGTTTGKAALVILIPFGVVLLVALVVLLIVGVALFTQR